MSPPEGVVAMKIDPQTGLHVADDRDGLVEYFYQENPPPDAGSGFGEPSASGTKPPEEVRDQLF
jgi:hypothetical protein